MGRFFSNVQIKDNMGRMMLVNLFCDMMKKRGLVPCSEDEAAMSYLLAFSEGGWVTLVSEEYSHDPQKVSEDQQQIAKALKTSCFSVTVVDSDFAMLELRGNISDSVIVGDGSGYGIEDAPRGNKECWEQLLADGMTWEQLSEIWNSNEVFVEDALWKAAPVLGINPEYMTADFEELSDKSDGDNNITALFFKKAEAKAKSMSLNAAFKKVFGEALEPLGFKLIKSRYPYFVRVVPGGEIIHVITCEESLCSYPRARKFDIVGGIATVYRYRIELDQNSKHNNTWLNSIGTFYARTVEKSEYNQKKFESLDDIGYDENDYLSLLNAMNRALELANRYMLPYLNRAVDLKSSLSCIRVLRQKCSTNNFSYPLNFESCGHHDEGFLYIKTNDEALKGVLKRKNDGIVPSDEQKRQEAAEEYEFFTDPDVLAELDRRKAVNTEILRTYGIGKR